MSASRQATTDRQAGLVVAPGAGSSRVGVWFAGRVSDRDLILRGYRAWNESLDDWLPTAHPDIEIDLSGLFPDFARVYRGHAGLADLWHRMHGAWERFRIEPEQIFAESDGAYTAEIRFFGRGSASGLDVEMKFSHGLRLDAGLVRFVISRRTLAEARTALRESQSP